MKQEATQQRPKPHGNPRHSGGEHVKTTSGTPSIALQTRYRKNW